MERIIDQDLMTRVNNRFKFEDNGIIPETLIVVGDTGGYHRARPNDVYEFIVAELARVKSTPNPS